MVSIRPRYTFDCDFGKVFASTSAVEREILARFNQLESLLDSPNEVAERVYDFLSDVSPPMSTRQRVLYPDFSLDDIFPKDRLYRTLYSIQVLTSHLGECNKLGVADQKFILHGANVLSRLLLDASRPISGIILLKCLPSLVDFLQERPLNSPPPPYLENAKELGFLLLEITECVQQMPFPAQVQTQSPAAPAPLSVRAQLTRLAYSVILQLARTDGLWPEIENSEDFISAHRQTLLSKDASVSHSLAILMGDFLKEKTRAGYEDVHEYPRCSAAGCDGRGLFHYWVFLVIRRGNLG